MPGSFGTGRWTVRSSISGFSRYQSAWPMTHFTASSACSEPSTARRIFMRAHSTRARAPSARCLAPCGHAAAERCALIERECLPGERQHERRFFLDVSAIEPGKALHVLGGKQRVLAARNGVEPLAQPRPLQIHRRVVAFQLVDDGGDLRARRLARLAPQERKEVLVLVAMVLHAGGVEVAHHEARRFTRLGVAAVPRDVLCEAFERCELGVDAAVAGLEHLERLVEAWRERARDAVHEKRIAPQAAAALDPDQACALDDALALRVAQFQVFTDQDGGRSREAPRAGGAAMPESGCAWLT